jgi:hypothetical protein
LDASVEKSKSECGVGGILLACTFDIDGEAPTEGCMAGCRRMCMIFRSVEEFNNESIPGWIPLNFARKRHAGAAGNRHPRPIPEHARAGLDNLPVWYDSLASLHHLAILPGE